MAFHCESYLPKLQRPHLCVEARAETYSLHRRATRVKLSANTLKCSAWSRSRRTRAAANGCGPAMQPVVVHSRRATRYTRTHMVRVNVPGAQQ
jgi:hypothetical protein